MLVSGMRLRRYQFVQVLATCFFVSLMLMWVQDDNEILNKIRAFSYRYLVNSYSFVNISLTVVRNRSGTTGFRYLINNEGKCEKEDVLLLVFVKNLPENRKRRDAIRNTWGNEDYIRAHYAINIKVMFALGIDKDPIRRRRHQKELELENKVHGDLIQQEFVDTFYNLTLKFLLQFGWANKYCSNAKFVMTADDDILVHTPNLITYLKGIALMGVKDFWVGNVNRGAPPIRSKQSKYYVPYGMYPWASYPDYTSGAAYVVSQDVAAKVYEASQTLNTSLYIDDVFMGICANKIGIVPQDHFFFAGQGKMPYHRCIYNRMITSHGHVDDIHYLWKQVTDPKVKDLTSGLWGHTYCKIVNIMLLCKIHFSDTYSCSAAWS